MCSDSKLRKKDRWASYRTATNSFVMHYASMDKGQPCMLS